MNSITLKFVRKVPVRFLLKIRDYSFVSKLSKDTNTTYSQAYDLVRKFEELGIIETKRLGRVRVVSLTEAGKELAESFRELERVCNGLEEKNEKEG